MRKPFQHHKSDYDKALHDYAGAIPPDKLKGMVDKSLRQWANSPLSFDLLVDMKVLKDIQDDIKRLQDDINDTK